MPIRFRGILAVFVLFVGILHARTPEDGIANRIDRLLAQATKPGDPGLAVLVKKDGKVVLERGYGVRRVGERANIDVDTNFRLASVTKQFTATAILLLIHDGKLDYDHRLTDIWPDFPAYGHAITIRHLLTHTSGLPDYEDLMEKEERKLGPKWSAEKQIQDSEVLTLLKQETKGKFLPGTSWEYSNSGYVVLGMIVAKVSGKTYGAFLEERVFEPAQMHQTIVYEAGKNAVSKRAYGHSKKGPSFDVTDQSATSATLGDGGIYSNVRDLSCWDDALEKHALLNESETLQMFTAVKLADGSQARWPIEDNGDNLAPGKPVSYGFGWFLDPYLDHVREWHSSSTLGFRNVIQRFTEGPLEIVILSNRTDLDPKTLSDQIAGYVLAK